MATPLPHESASVAGSRSRAFSSALGASPSAASRSASSRVSLSRPPPMPPAALAATQRTIETDDPGLAEGVAEAGARARARSRA